MEITIPADGTLYLFRDPIATGPGSFATTQDGVYFVNQDPVLVLEKLEEAKAKAWAEFLESEHRTDIAKYQEIRRLIQAVKVLFAKNDFFGAHKLILSWK